MFDEKFHFYSAAGWDASTQIGFSNSLHNQQLQTTNKRQQRQNLDKVEKKWRSTWTSSQRWTQSLLRRWFSANCPRTFWFLPHTHTHTQSASKKTIVCKIPRTLPNGGTDPASVEKRDMRDTKDMREIWERYERDQTYQNRKREERTQPRWPFSNPKDARTSSGEAKDKLFSLSVALRAFASSSRCAASTIRNISPLLRSTRAFAPCSARQTMGTQQLANKRKTQNEGCKTNQVQMQRQVQS